MHLKIVLLFFTLLFLSGCSDNGNYYNEYSSQSLISGYKSYQIIEEGEEVVDVCCKHCSKGKACGDSCISRSYTCHKPPGCACDY